MQVVNLPDTVTDQGVVAQGGQALIRTLEDGTVEQVPIGGQGAKATSASNQGGAPAQPRNKQEYDALPKGAQYIKNGVTYVKG